MNQVSILIDPDKIFSIYVGQWFSVCNKGTNRKKKRVEKKYTEMER